MSTTLIVSESLSRFAEVRFAMSTRRGGANHSPFDMNLSYRVGDDDANVAKNRNKFFGALGFDSDCAAYPVQCHSNNVKIALGPGEYNACDALVTSRPNLPLVVTIADCVPIVLFDARQKALALVHAGWKGTAQRITENAVHMMSREFGSLGPDVIAYLGPSAGVCCYQVDPEVAGKYPERTIERRNNKLYLDLKEANLQQLMDCGINREHIEVSSYCTICHPELFHSWRRDKEQSGRMMAAASLVLKECD